MICKACGKEIIGQAKKAKVQYNYRDGGLYHHYYYRYCEICKRCWYLRILSFIIGIIVGVLYGIFYFKIMMNTDYVILKIIYIFLLNPLFIAVFAGVMFRMITNCDVELDKEGNLKDKEWKRKDKAYGSLRRAFFVTAWLLTNL